MKRAFMNCGWKLAEETLPNIFQYIFLHQINVLPAVHTLSECSYTSKVGTKQATLKANPVDNLQGFGCSQNRPSDDEVERAESYLVNVVKNGTTCTTMDA